MGCENIAAGMNQMMSGLNQASTIYTQGQTQAQTKKISKMLSEQLGDPDLASVSDPALLNSMITYSLGKNKVDYQDAYYKSLTEKNNRTDPNASSGGNVPTQPTIVVGKDGQTYAVTTTIDKQTGQANTSMQPVALPQGGTAFKPGGMPTKLPEPKGPGVMQKIKDLLGGGTPAPAAPSTPIGNIMPQTAPTKMRVKLKSTGQPGMIPSDKFDPKLYEQF